MEEIEKQYQLLLEAFPDASLVDDAIYHVRLTLMEGVWLEVNYKKYPKQPKVSLIKADGSTYKKLSKTVESLKSWNKNNPLLIKDLIQDIINVINGVANEEVFIKHSLFQGILAYCSDHHPREILGLLRINNNVVVEFILPPGAVTSNKSGVFSPSRLPMDMSLNGTVHSHPSGNPYPSEADLVLFKKKRVNFIVGYPYDIFTVRCFDQLGNEIRFEVIDG